MPSRIAAIVLLLLGGQALGELTADQVVVVVNKSVADSVELGEYYCEQRGLAEDHLVSLALPISDTMSLEQYNTQLVEPLKKALIDRKLDKKVTCILTIRGVPFRIRATKRTASEEALLAWAKKTVTKTHGRLIVDYQLLKMVGTHFPEKAAKVTSIDRVADLFDASVTMPAKPATAAMLKKHIPSLIKGKIEQLDRITDADKRAVAERQILAISADALGLAELSKLLATIHPEGAPSTEDVARRAKALNEELGKALGPGTRDNITKELLARAAKALQELGGAVALNEFTQTQATNVGYIDTAAAVDNELCLMWWKQYPRDKFLNNPLLWKIAIQFERIIEKLGPVMMVSRLDGPTYDLARRMIDDSIEVEKAGLKGKLYIDAGGKYPWFDTQFLLPLAKAVGAETSVPVVLDKKKSLFPVGSCSDVALYVGWYSLRKYVPAFTWNKGAVGFHVASFEAVHMRDPKSSEWVPRMIGEGVAATIGPSDEPFLQAFPPPTEFFPLLMTGKVTIAEAYWRTTPKASWRMMLIADPLYNPFKSAPHAMKLPKGLMPGEKVPATPTVTKIGG